MDVFTSRVSVIVPIYNVERFLSQCLSSIAGQTYKNLEIICINDGSTDRSLEIVDEFAAKDSRFVVIDKQNEGYGAGCNQGIDAASGEWISIVEPDDWIEPTMYEDMLAFAGNFAEVDIVKTPWTDITNWDAPSCQGIRRCPFKGKIRTSKKVFKIGENTVLLKHHPSIWSAIYRKDFLLDKKIRFMEIPGAGWADNPFLIETLCQAENIAYLDREYYNYRCDLPGSTLNHVSEAAISRPFDRWDDMLSILNRLHVADARILAAHYVRGFNYAYGAMADDGWDNVIVKRRTKLMFQAMDPDIVSHIPEISPNRKELFFSLRNEECPSLSKLPWLRYLLMETAITVKYDGFRKVFTRAARLVSR